MSASPKTGLEPGVSATPLAATLLRATPKAESSSGDALQALLAFSALHQQIRQRRAHVGQDSAASTPAEAWQLEHFVLDEVLQSVAERALAITGADGVAIAMAEGEAIVCRAVSGKVTPDAGARLEPNSGFSGACLSSGQVVRCDDSQTDLRVNAAACQVLGARSMVAVPLLARQTVIGLVEAFSSEAHGFNDCDVRGLSLLAELILAAVRPEEEDRLAEISRRVMPQAPVVEAVVAAAEKTPAQPKAAPPQEAQVEKHEAKVTAKVEEAEAIAAVPAVEDAKATPVAAAIPDSRTAKSSRPGLAVVMALIVVAATLGAGMWWSMRHHAPSKQPSSRTQTNSASPAQAPALSVEEAQTAEPAPEESEPETTAASGQKPEVTGIRHWSSADSSTVVIDLQDQVQYEAHRLSHPERIYLDLPDTRLAASLFNKTINVDDVLLERVRVAQPTHGVTRVVLETKGASNFSVSLEPNPYRLVIELRTIGAEPKPRAKVELFAPQDQAAPETSIPGKNARNKEPDFNPAGEPKLRIVLDAGHGGWDLGTVGRKGLLEKDLVLDIVERLGKLVAKRLSAKVIYTRTDDSYVALEKRAEVANLAKADLFLSVHANYSDFPSARGVETYYTNTYSSIRARSREYDDAGTAATDVDWTNVDIREKVHESRQLAASIQRALYGTLSAKNPGLPNRGVKEAQYVVLTGTSMPAVLAEVSFVSSPTDENNLQSSSYRQRIAEALYRGVAHYAEQNLVKMASAERPVGQ